MHKQVLLMSRVVAVAALALSGTAFAAGQSSQTAFKDPATGRMREPTAAEAQELHAARAAERAAMKAEGAAARAAANAPAVNVPVRQSNGAIQITPDEDTMTYSVMTRNAAGELVLQCVTGAASAQAAMSTPATTDSKEHQHEVQ